MLSIILSEVIPGTAVQGRLEKLGSLGHIIVVGPFCLVTIASQELLCEAQSACVAC